MYLLGFDVGSSSVKASLVDIETGKCVGDAFYPSTEAPIISHKPGWAEAAFSLLSALFVWKMVPETKGKTLEDMSKMWRKN